MKRCSTCGVEKSLESFYRYKRNKDGHLGVCKRCFLARKYELDGIRRAGHRWLWMGTYQVSPRAGVRGSGSARGGRSAAS
jgi:hypothetical protein